MSRVRRLLRSQNPFLIASILLILLVGGYLFATRPPTKEQPPEDVLDARAFQDLLTHADQVATIERIRIEPRGHGEGRYVLTLRSSARKRVVYAEFPGTLTRQIYEAGIAYSVKSKASLLEDTPVKMREIDATSFQQLLRDKEEVDRIESIRAEILGPDHARYVVSVKGESSKRVVYAEFPGTIVQQIQDAKIEYSVVKGD